MLIKNPRLEIIYWTDITEHGDKGFEEGGLTHMCQAGFVVWEDDEIVKLSHSIEMPIKETETLRTLEHHDYFVVPKGVIKKRIELDDFEKYMKKLR